MASGGEQGRNANLPPGTRPSAQHQALCPAPGVGSSGEAEVRPGAPGAISVEAGSKTGHFPGLLKFRNVKF